MKARNQPVSLPAAIAAYWAAANAGQAVPAAACFASDAEVQDENRTHQGRSEIQAWIEETTRKYQPQVEPLQARETGAGWTVVARVTGRFPGSPIELDFGFTLAGDRIAKLQIS
ncbi:MAG: nuclear transport factor 2 family protein [Lacunisphaera sp.]